MSSNDSEKPSKRPQDVMVTVTISAADCIVERDNHGGYQGGRCIVCRGHGWANTGLGASNEVHAPDCPVLAALRENGCETAI